MSTFNFDWAYAPFISGTNEAFNVLSVWILRTLPKRIVELQVKTGTHSRYHSLVYTKTVDSAEGARWLARQTPNILRYLPPSNSRENGVSVCMRDKWKNHPN